MTVTIKYGDQEGSLPVTSKTTSSKVVQVNSGVLYLSWSWSGSSLALGQEDGRISLRDSAGAEIMQTAPKGAIAGIAWLRPRSPSDDIQCKPPEHGIKNL